MAAGTTDKLTGIRADLAGLASQAGGASVHNASVATTFVGLNFKSSPMQDLKKKFRKLATTVKKELMGDIGEYWHAELFTKHFESGNQSEYHIAPRTSRYWVGETLKGKFKLGTKRIFGIGKGTTVANVLRGVSERRMENIYEISGTSGHVTITMDAPDYFVKPYDPHGKQPDKVREVLEVSPRDLMLLNGFAQRRLQQMAEAAIAGKA